MLIYIKIINIVKGGYNMKEWTNPEINELGVESTEHGYEVTDKIDDVYVDADTKFKYYSFS